MTDFMRWLYANYIKPQVEQSDITGYEEAFSLKGTSLCPDMEEACDRLLEFYAGNAFLLGLRTGAGLEASMGGSSRLPR